LKQIGVHNFGFQKCGSSIPATRGSVTAFGSS
jgi:hypothetical protein